MLFRTPPQNTPVRAGRRRGSSELYADAPVVYLRISRRKSKIRGYPQYFEAQAHGAQDSLLTFAAFVNQGTLLGLSTLRIRLQAELSYL